MKALRWHGREDLRYEDVPEPSPGPGQVKAKVHFSGICGTDWHEYRYGPIFVPQKPHPLTGTMYPLTLGHEFSATVVEVGKGVTGFKPGDRVTGDCIWHCSKCYYCMNGMPNLCVKVAFTGHHVDGSMAEYLVAPDYTFYKLPDSVSYEAAVFTEPLAVSMHAVRKSELRIGDTAAIVGAGTVGLLTILAVRAAGASRIYVLEISETRAKKALEMGATAVINPKDGDPVQEIRDLSAGLGVDVSFECAGHPSSAPLAIQLARKAGTVVIVGISPKPTPEFSFFNIFHGEKSVIGSVGYVRDSIGAIELIASGRVDPTSLITAKVPLKDAVEKGFKEIINNPDRHFKILIES